MHKPRSRIRKLASAAGSATVKALAAALAALVELHRGGRWYE